MRHAHIRQTTVTAFAALCLGASLLVSACTLPGQGSARSVASFCDAYWRQKYEYLHKYEARNRAIADSSGQDPLGSILAGLETSIEAIGDIATMFDTLDKVAPDEIEPDVAAIRDAFKQAVGTIGATAGNPLAALPLLISSMAIQGNWERLGRYLIDNCGEHP